MDWPGSASKVLRSENPQKLPSLIPRNSTDVLMIQDHREVPGKERNKTRVVASSEVAGNAVENGSGLVVFAAVRTAVYVLNRRRRRAEGERPEGGESVCGCPLTGGGRGWPEKPGRVGDCARVLRRLEKFRIFF